MPWRVYPAERAMVRAQTQACAQEQLHAEEARACVTRNEGCMHAQFSCAYAGTRGMRPGTRGVHAVCLQSPGACPVPRRACEFPYARPVPWRPHAHLTLHALHSAWESIVTVPKLFPYLISNYGKIWRTIMFPRSIKKTSLLKEEGAGERTKRKSPDNKRKD